MGRRRWFIAAVLVLALVASGLVLLSTRGGREQEENPGSASIALDQLDAKGGEPYVGRMGDVSDPTALRKALRAEFRGDGEHTDRRGSDTRARRCAKRLRRADGAGAGRVVLLAGAPSVVVAFTDRGRVVTFVADTRTCEVRLAQSL